MLHCADEPEGRHTQDGADISILKRNDIQGEPRQNSMICMAVICFSLLEAQACEVLRRQSELQSWFVVIDMISLNSHMLYNDAAGLPSW